MPHQKRPDILRRIRQSAERMQKNENILCAERSIAMNKGFKLDKALGYFKYRGVDIMAFDDIYPEGHQSGVSILMHGNRAATNGDLRFEQTPGQWQPLPKQVARTLNEEENIISPVCIIRIWTGI